MSYTSQPQYSRRDFLERTVRGVAGTGAVLATGGLSAVLAQETKSKTREPTFDIELDGLRGVFYAGGGNKYFFPDVLEVYQNGQLKWKILDTGDGIIGNVQGLGHDKDALQEYENGKLVGRYQLLRTYHRGARGDAWSHGQTNDMLRGIGRKKLQEATVLYQKFLKAGFAR